MWRQEDICIIAVVYCLCELLPLVSQFVIARSWKVILNYNNRAGPQGWQYDKKTSLYPYTHWKDKLDSILQCLQYIIRYIINEFEQNEQTEQILKVPAVLKQDKPDAIYSHRKLQYSEHMSRGIKAGKVSDR